MARVWADKSSVTFKIHLVMTIVVLCYNYNYKMYFRKMMATSFVSGHNPKSTSQLWVKSEHVQCISARPPLTSYNDYEVCSALVRSKASGCFKAMLISRANAISETVNNVKETVNKSAAPGSCLKPKYAVAKPIIMSTQVATPLPTAQ